jgi:bile acid:Na+ symporter, BASS family
MLIMFCMGLTLSLNDFKRVIHRKAVIALGVSLQFIIMPLSAYLISKGLNLSQELLIGMVLVGSTAGGTASNVICFLAKGDIALSVTLTLCSTLLAVFLTPLLTTLYLGQTIDIDAWGMLSTVFSIVALPVILGAAINIRLNSKIVKIKPILPLISMLFISLIIAIIVSLTHDKFSMIGPMLLLAVILHNGSGLILGYLIPRALKHDETTCRTIAIEVGMQNSGLSILLASKHFMATAALPGAVFSIWHNISGSVLASAWGHFHKIKGLK